MSKSKKSKSIKEALKFCRENRSKINDTFYSMALKTIDPELLEEDHCTDVDISKLYLDWNKCLDSMSADTQNLNFEEVQTLKYWQLLIGKSDSILH